MPCEIREIMGNVSAKRTLAILLLVGVVSVVYANSIFNGFAWDDEPLILEKKEYFSDPASVVNIVVTPDQALNEGGTPYYRPITTLTYFFDNHAWGGKPYWYHLENLLIHGSVVLLLYFLICNAFHSRVLAVFSCLVFAVHPVNAEAVNFISARNNLLCALFMLASLLTVNRKGFRWVLLFSLTYLVSLLSKEPAVVMPFFLLSLNVLSKEEKQKPDIMCLGASLLAVILYFFLRYKILGSFTTKMGIDISVNNLKLVCSTLFEYFRLMLFPHDLNAMYTLEYISFHTYKGIIAAAGLSLVVYFSFRRNTPEPVRVACLWILWGFLPISNIVKIPSAPVAERYLYIPLIGYSLVVGYLVHALYVKKETTGILAIAGLAILLSAVTYDRNSVWKGNVSLFQSMIRSDPDNVRAHFNLGYEYMESGRKDLAFFHWREAIRIDPSFSKAHNNLGNLYALSADYRSAIEHYEKGLSLSPETIIIQYNIARAAELMGEREKAARYYRMFLRDAESSPIAEHQENVRKAKEYLNTFLRN